ncbi:MAG: hypothetical protein ACJA0E_001469 [Bermanella sp.]
MLYFNVEVRSEQAIIDFIAKIPAVLSDINFNGKQAGVSAR